MSLACRLHLAAVVPVESVQAGNILMGFDAGVDKAAGIALGTGKSSMVKPRRSWPHKGGQRIDEQGYGD